MMFSASGEEAGEKRLKNHMAVSKGQFKYPVGVVLSISGEGVTVGEEFLRWGGIWRARDARSVGVEVELPPE